MVKTELISKSELARRLKVSPAMVTKHIAKGLPVEPNGRVDWNKAQHWHRCYVVPELSGSHAARQRKREAAQATQEPAPRTTRDLFETLARNSAMIPELLIRAGVRDVDLAYIGAEVFVSLLFYLCDDIDDEAYPNPDELPGVPDLDLDLIAAMYGLAPPDTKRVEELLDPIDIMFCTRLEELREKQPCVYLGND